MKVDNRNGETESHDKAEAGPLEEQTLSFPVVGIGASAGGLAAFEAFFSGLSHHEDPGMAYVLVQHLAPDHESHLAELVARSTKLPVRETTDGQRVQVNSVYIIPPNRDMALQNGTLQLMEPVAPRGHRKPIDFFFRSLAQDLGARAIGIILSGTGSDGTLGIRDIKARGGMVMAQSPGSTEFDGMPSSAMATGMVDSVLAPAEMAAKLKKYVARASPATRPAVEPQVSIPDGPLKKVCVILRAKTGHDFSLYKPNTIRRRVERRMAVHQIDTVENYVRYLQQNAVEVEKLFADLLIGVTSFFRDPEVFESLKALLAERTMSGQWSQRVLRAWCAGCSTGEESYSLAILLAEALEGSTKSPAAMDTEALHRPARIQIFATDIDRNAITTARAGTYPSSIATDVSAERLARRFTVSASGVNYTIHKSLRDRLVFSEQNIIKDPPFSRLDLISCRNLLIYMGSELQRRLIPMFHYALNPGGLLLLGTSESVGDFSDLFAPLDREHKIYERRDDFHRLPRHTIVRTSPTHDVATAPRPTMAHSTIPEKTPLRTLTEQALLRKYAAVAALVNARGDILYLHGRAGLYLEPTPGEAGVNNILKMAREGLHLELATALHRAAAGQGASEALALKVKTNGDWSFVNLCVAPLEREPQDATAQPLFLVTLELTPPSAPASADSAPASADSAEPKLDSRIADLERNLRAKEEYLQSTIEELETSNEELKSSNEELQSVNEELQSTNEELETSKEELQSVNEELATVNTELQTKVAEQSRANNDMNNLLAGTGIATVFVDHALHILRFTPTMTRIIHLIDSDLGRPVGHLASNLEAYDGLVEDTQKVLDTLIPKEVEVRTSNGSWYTMRIQPYRTTDDVIEGAVITFVEITARKKVEKALLVAQALANGIVATVREPLLVLDGDLCVVSVNPSFCRVFGVSQRESVGCTLNEFSEGEWALPELRSRLQEVLTDGPALEKYAMEIDVASSGRRGVLLNARRIEGDVSTLGMLLVSVDVIPED